MTGSYPVPHTKAVALFQQQLQWKTAFTLILWGFCLMMLQFQYFFEYAFLLPALGMVFTFLGFYRLRNENKAMHSCCTLSLIALFIYPFYLLATTLPLFIFSWFHWCMVAFQILYLVYLLVLLFLFRKGFQQMSQQTNHPVQANAIAVLLLCTLLQQLLAYTYLAQSMLTWLFISVVFLLSIWVIWINALHLPEAGYRLQTPSSNLQDGWCIGAYSLIIALLIISGIVFTMSLYF